MNDDKLNYIKDKLGDNYLYELDMDIDAENNMPAYEFYNTVSTQFEMLYPKLNQEYEDSIQPDIPDQDEIDMMNVIDIYKDFARFPYSYRCPKSFFASNFKDKQTIILNQVKFKYGSVNAMIDYLAKNPAGKTHGHNNKELLNHIKYVAKMLKKQYSEKR